MIQCSYRAYEKERVRVGGGGDTGNDAHVFKNEQILSTCCLKSIIDTREIVLAVVEVP